MSRVTQGQGPLLTPSMLPIGENVIFEDSTFFARGHGSFPSPEEVRQLGNTGPWAIPTPVSFRALNLLVKYGPKITVAEGQCMWAIRKLLPSVPVPEIYGWCRDEGHIFLYMQLIDGITLADAWPDLDVEEKYELCGQLDGMLGDLRELRQDPANPFIGSINGDHVKDVIFEGREPAGIFPDVASFHDWFANIKRPPGQDPKTFPSFWRPSLLDESSIVFIHADLHRSNIMTSRGKDGKPKVTALIDWHQSGWYPAPWEFYKTQWTSKATAAGTDRWEMDFILEFLDSYRGGIAWQFFSHGL